MELFRYPIEFIWLVAGFSALMFFYFKARAASERASLNFINARQLILLSGERALSRKRTRAILYLTGLAFLLVAAGGPQWGTEMSPVADINGSLVVAVDTSLSMGAEDVKPSRIENAKLLLNSLFDKFPDYRLGIIAFSGEAYVQCPLTTDSDAIKYFLSFLAPGILPVPGTDIASAITAAETMLGRYSGQKVLVLITDGEDLAGKVDGALDSAAAANLKIFTVGVGKTEGELIPEGDQSGNTTGYKKDTAGKTVVTRLDETTLLKIAQKTGAEYIRYGGDPDAAAQEIRGTVARIAMSKTKGFGKASYKNRYQAPLLLALLLLLIEFMFMEKGYSMPAFLTKLLTRFRKAKAPTVLLFATLVLSSILPGASRAASPESLARSGNSAYAQKDFPKAYDYYSKALEKGLKNKKIIFNRGAAYYRMEDYGKAAGEFEEAAKNPKFKSAAAYNAGNAYFKGSELPKAIEKYRQAILAAPGDQNAKYNLQVALEQQKQNQCDKKSDKQDQKKKDQQQKKDQQKQQQENKEGGGEDQKKQEERRKKEAARQQADKLMELMKEKEKSSANKEMMNARYANQPKKEKPPTGKDW